MKKGKIIITLGLAAVMSAGSVMGVWADDPVNENPYNSEGTFQFNNDLEGDPEPNELVDPEYPDEIIKEEPDDGGKTNNVGLLTLDYVSNFRFGSARIKQGEQSFYAKPKDMKDADGNDIKVPNYVQVTDLRGDGNGWRLTVKQDQFKVSDDENEYYGTAQGELDGARIIIENMEADTEAESGVITVPSTVTLEGDKAETNILTAQRNKGLGTHVGRFGKTRETGVEEEEQSGLSSVKLVIPGKANKLAADYKSVLTWTLYNTPDGTELAGQEEPETP